MWTFKLDIPMISLAVRSLSYNQTFPEMKQKRFTRIQIFIEHDTNGMRRKVIYVFSSFAPIQTNKDVNLITISPFFIACDVPISFS